MELWDLYDKNRNKLGIDHIRGNELPDNCYHLVVHIWIKNKEGKYLISQRSKTKPIYPLMWECVGGSVTKGENSFEGAIREVKEEVGIDLDGNLGKMIYTETRGFINGKKANDIMDVWLFEYDGPVDLNNATTDEVCDIKWMTKNEIKELFDTGRLVPTLDYFFDKINI